MKPVFLGIDAGTTKIKMSLFDENLREIATAGKNLTVYTPEPDASEIDMDELWGDLCEVSGTLKKTHPEAFPHLAGIGISGQGDGYWPLDGKKRPVCRAMLWNDSRSKSLGIDGTPGLEELLKAECANNIYAGSMPALQKWLKAAKPEIYAKVRIALHCKDWLNFKLTGRVVSDYSDITCSSGMNIRTLRYFPKLYDLLDIPEALGTMPEAVSPTEVIGHLTREAAAQTGLPAGVPVIAGCLDCNAVSIGTDFYQRGQACTIIGTSMINEVCIGKDEIDPGDLRGLLIYHVAPGRYIKMMNAAGGSSSTDIIKKILCPDESFEEMFRKLEDVPVGSRGVLFHPYLFGERAPFKNPYAFASFFGLRSYHTKYDMMRSAYEGLAMAFVDAYRHVSNIDVVYLSGGASVSPFVCQMFCDAIGWPVKRQTIGELGPLGIAKMLKVALGYAKDYSELEIDSYVQYTPDPARHKAYQALYEDFVSFRTSVAPHWKPGRA